MLLWSLSPGSVSHAQTLVTASVPVSAFRWPLSIVVLHSPSGDPGGTLAQMRSLRLCNSLSQVHGTRQRARAGSPSQPRPAQFPPPGLPVLPVLPELHRGVQEGPGALDTGSPQWARRWTPVPPQWPVWPAPGQCPAPLPEARAQRVRQEGPCLILASLMPTGGL